nr:hypothetical protein Iba_chr03fCG3430 [Ipomoea batatas]
MTIFEAGIRGFEPVRYTLAINAIISELDSNAKVSGWLEVHPAQCDAWTYLHSQPQNGIATKIAFLALPSRFFRCFKELADRLPHPYTRASNHPNLTTLHSILSILRHIKMKWKVQYEVYKILSPVYWEDMELIGQFSDSNWRCQTGFRSQVLLEKLIKFSGVGMGSLLLVPIRKIGKELDKEVLSLPLAAKPSMFLQLIICSQQPAIEAQVNGSSHEENVDCLHVDGVLENRNLVYCGSTRQLCIARTDFRPVPLEDTLNRKDVNQLLRHVAKYLKEILNQPSQPTRLNG